MSCCHGMPHPSSSPAVTQCDFHLFVHYPKLVADVIHFIFDKRAYVTCTFFMSACSYPAFLATFSYSWTMSGIRHHSWNGAQEDLGSKKIELHFIFSDNFIGTPNLRSLWSSLTRDEECNGRRGTEGFDDGSVKRVESLGLTEDLATGENFL